jgi:hypothetical protein
LYIPLDATTRPLVASKDEVELAAGGLLEHEFGGTDFPSDG